VLGPRKWLLAHKLRMNYAAYAVVNSEFWIRIQTLNQKKSKKMHAQNAVLCCAVLN